MKVTSLAVAALCATGIVAAGAAMVHTAGTKGIWVALAVVALAPMLGLELSARRRTSALALGPGAEGDGGTGDQLAEVIHVDFRRGRAA